MCYDSCVAQNSSDAFKSEWVIRDALPEDEACLVSMWLKSFAHATELREAYPLASVDGSTGEIAYWRAYRPIVMALLDVGRVRVACPPMRAEYTDDRAAVIAGWVCTTPGLVHWVAVKRSVAKIADGDTARDMVAELLGTDVGAYRATFDLLDARKLGMLADIKRDRAWLDSLREVSRRSLARDETYARVLGGIMTADTWTPSSERAA